MAQRIERAVLPRILGALLESIVEPVLRRDVAVAAVRVVRPGRLRICLWIAAGSAAPDTAIVTRDRASLAVAAISVSGVSVSVSTVAVSTAVSTVAVGRRVALITIRV